MQSPSSYGFQTRWPSWFQKKMFSLRNTISRLVLLISIIKQSGETVLQQSACIPPRVHESNLNIKNYRGKKNETYAGKAKQPLVSQFTNSLWTCQLHFSQCAKHITVGKIHIDLIGNPRKPWTLHGRAADALNTKSKLHTFDT